MILGLTYLKFLRISHVSHMEEQNTRQLLTRHIQSPMRMILRNGILMSEHSTFPGLVPHKSMKRAISSSEQELFSSRILRYQRQTVLNISNDPPFQDASFWDPTGSNALTGRLEAVVGFSNGSSWTGNYDIPLHQGQRASTFLQWVSCNDAI